VLRGIFGFKRNEVTGEWRRLHNEELYDLYCSPSIVRGIKSRTMRWDGNVARVGEGTVVHRVLVRIPEGKRPLGRPSRRWKDNIKRIFKKWGGGIHRIVLAQDRNKWRALGNAIMSLQFSYNAGNFLTGLSGRTLLRELDENLDACG